LIRVYSINICLSISLHRTFLILHNLGKFISTPTYAHNHILLSVYFPLYVFRRI
jgi:hypothetical protein